MENIYKDVYSFYSESHVLGDNLIIILVASIPAFVTILGFVVTYFLNKRNFIEEINKYKTSLGLDKTANLPYQIQELYELIMETSEDKKKERAVLSDFKKILMLIFAYGSKDAIALATNMQEMNYLRSTNPDKKSSYDNIAYVVLLLCQTKYDLTEIQINPEFWYRMQVTDYASEKPLFKNANNKIVKRLSLNSFLRMR